MPPQRSVLGHLLNLRSLPRRFQLVLALTLSFVFTILLFGTPSRDSIPTVEDLKHPKIPHKLNPFGPTAHKPPIQANSTRGDSSWFSSWNWHNPFSSTITLDESRSVLPPLHERLPVYTFYDEDKKKDEAVLKAENDLLLIWRRAWWAQGFRPVVLGRAEAMENPLYDALQRIGLQPELEAELAKWLAWSTMGTGVLTNWLALPMAAYDHPELVYLRRGEYQPDKISRFEHLKNGIFVGERQTIKKAIEKLILKSNITEAKTAMEVLPDNDIQVEKSSGSIAYYDKATIGTLYKTIHDELSSKNSATGLQKLATLLNAHLHLTWQNNFSAGIAILKPLPEHTSALVLPALDIARNLTQCPLSPIPLSCPPNNQHCSPCPPTRPLIYTTHFTNTSHLFTIATVPHPYTLTSLHYQQQFLTPRFLRRETLLRDLYTSVSTAHLLPPKSSAASRVVRLKEAIHAPRKSSLWLTAEAESPADLAWIFGFVLPSQPPYDNSPRPEPAKSDFPPPSAAEFANERKLLEKAREALRLAGGNREIGKLVETVEMWNLADTEAWRFARDYSARRKVERAGWEEGERGFAGAEEGRKEGGWGSWVGAVAGGRKKGEGEGEGRWQDD